MINSQKRLSPHDVTERIIRCACNISEGGLNGKFSLFGLRPLKRVRLDSGDKSRLRNIISGFISQMSPEENDLFLLDSQDNINQYAVNLLYNFYNPSYNQ